jgi:hypothetical protein
VTFITRRKLKGKQWWLPFKMKTLCRSSYGMTLLEIQMMEGSPALKRDRWVPSLRGRLAPPIGCLWFQHQMVSIPESQFFQIRIGLVRSLVKRDMLNLSLYWRSH